MMSEFECTFAILRKLCWKLIDGVGLAYIASRETLTLKT